VLTYSDLVPYLSPDNQQVTTYTAKTSFPTTPSVGTRHTEEHTQTRESHPPSKAWHILPPLTPNTTNTTNTAGALPPRSLHFSQQASTVGYNHGHSQWPIHEQVPQGSNRASESTASIPPSLLDTLGNYLQLQDASKRQRVGNRPQDTSESESNMSAWNGTSVGNQTGTKYSEIRERRS
jgi:hypothetical protein